MSIRNDLDVYFKFPEPQELKIRLKDVLDPQVDEKYYLSDEQTKRLKTTTYNTGSEGVRVQNIDGEARTLCARDYKDPKCVRVGGLYDNGSQKHQAGSIYDPNGISATLSTMRGGNQEPFIVASRGRNPNNPSDRTTGAPTVQRLEPRKDGVTNTITSVQKDNYVAEPTPLQRKVCNEAIARGLVEPNDAIEYTYSNARLKEIGGGILKSKI